MSCTRRRGWLLMAVAAVAATACAPSADVAIVSARPTRDIATPPDDPDDPTVPDEPTVPDDPSDPVAPVNPGEEIVQPEIYETVDFDSVITTDGAKPPRPQDELVALSFADIERWWAEEYPNVFGEEFEPLEGGVYAGYRSNTIDIPGCDPGTSVTDYDTVQLYLAFYCPNGDFIAYDDDDEPNSMLSPIAEQFGPSVFGVVLAHEYGHAIQERQRVFDLGLPTIFTEQQADCYAGAWVGQSYRGESPVLRLGDADVRSSLLALLEVRDPVGLDQMSDGGHGSAFDRVGAFEEGFSKGAARCAELIDDPLELIPNEFVSNSDIEVYSEGNAPYECSDLDREQMIEDGFDPERADELITNCTPGPEFLVDDLNNFWQVAIGDTFPDLTSIPVDDLAGFACADKVQLNEFVLLCPSQQTVAYDGPEVEDLYRQFGDFTLGYLDALAWAEQAQISQSSTLAGEARALVDDCFVGAWVRDITPRPGGSPPTTRDKDGNGIPDNVTSSPGDLDEATRMAILTGDQGANTNKIGTPFEKIAALRLGALSGYQACAAQVTTD